MSRSVTSFTDVRCAIGIPVIQPRKEAGLCGVSVCSVDPYMTTMRRKVETPENERSREWSTGPNGVKEGEYHRFVSDYEEQVERARSLFSPDIQHTRQSSVKSDQRHPTISTHSEHRTPRYPRRRLFGDRQATMVQRGSRGYNNWDRNQTQSIIPEKDNKKDSSRCSRELNPICSYRGRLKVASGTSFLTELPSPRKDSNVLPDRDSVSSLHQQYAEFTSNQRNRNYSHDYDSFIKKPRRDDGNLKLKPPRARHSDTPERTYKLKPPKDYKRLSPSLTPAYSGVSHQIESSKNVSQNNIEVVNMQSDLHQILREVKSLSQKIKFLQKRVEPADNYNKL